MVTGSEGMSSACREFTQNAWRKDLCANCQRSRGEHVSSDTAGQSTSQTTQKQETESPRPAKRNSLMARSWTAQQPEGPNQEIQNDDEKWDAMCRPDIEHSYEDIDESHHSAQQSSVIHSAERNVLNDEDLSDSKEEKGRVTVTLPRDSKSRSRSSSRDKSPLPAPKPKVIPNKMPKTSSSNSPKFNKKELESDSIKNTSFSLDLESDVLSSSPKRDGTSKTEHSSKIKVRNIDKTKACKVEFVTSEPAVIAEDGGYDNFFLDNEEHLKETDDEIKEILVFTEQEKEWALLALKNTIWNSSVDNLKEDGAKLRTTQSKEFEDIELESLWKPDRFANVKDCVFPEPTVYGTYPLRSKSGKSAIDSLFDGSSLETIDETYETFLKYGFGDSKEAEIGAKLDRLIANEVDLSDANYDDPWGDKFGFDTESDMNLLDEIKGEIDLDSSSAGMALVDLLNDVLSKYSTGTPSETDSVKNMDNFYEDDLDKKEKKNKKPKKESKELPTELEAKVVTLAASLRLKQRAKRHAPRPPSCPPAPPVGHQVHPKSPAEQLEIRAAQSKEPMFKMVPVGKPIGNSPVAQAQSTPTPKKIESVQENMEGYKLKDDKDKPKRGGITGFFRNFLRRSKGSESDLATSSETVVSNISQPSVQPEPKPKLEKENSPAKTREKSSSSSPQMKLKVLPGRPVSPKPPPDKPPDKPIVNVSSTNNKEAKSAEPSLETKDVGSIISGDKTTEEKSPTNSDIKRTSPVENKSKSKSPPSSLNSSTKSSSSAEKDQPSPPSSKSKEAPALPTIGPRQLSDSVLQPPRPRMRGNSDGGPSRSRPRTRDMPDSGRPRDTPNVPPPKPPVAAKPKPVTQSQSVDTSDKCDAKPPLNKSLTTSPPRKERVSSTSSLDDDMLRTKGARDSNPKTDPTILRKRAKSPKRFHAPAAPRASLPNVLSESSSSISSSNSQTAEPKPLAFAKELELKLQKEAGNFTEVKKMSAPPPPSPTSKVVLESEGSPRTGQKSSKDNIKESPKCRKETETIKQNEETVNATSSVDLGQDVKKEDDRDDTQIPPIEKIELPKPASSSRKSFLGKLNRKNKPPPPPSVKRTKSITESSVQGDQLHLKKIHVDLKDISGPVLITEMSSSKIVNRRNTISLGDDNAFLSGGSTSSGSTSTTGEKSEISPQGSLENMYELITPEAPPPPLTALTDKRNLYDPVSEKQVSLRPPSINSLGIEGYLEPVRSNGGANINTSEPVKPITAESSDGLVSIATSMGSSSTEVTPENIPGVLVQDGNVPTEVTNIDNLESLDISEERRQLLATQPIYEEINGYGKLDGTDVIAGVDSADSRPILNGDPQLCQTLEKSSLNIDNPLTRTSPSLQSKDSFSSESDLSSAGNSLSRAPRPIPRRRPRHSVGVGFEQYVAMNRPSVAVFLNEDQLREILSKLTAMNLQTLRELYTQHEKTFTKENVHLGVAGPLKWIDFDIYGKPVHASERCVVYNAKLKQGQSPCQIMLFHSRPEMTTANHPSLLKPTCIFTDSVPYSYLTEDFIKTSQLLQTSVNQSNSAKCYIVVGLFDITESVTHHLSSLESLCENQKDFLCRILFYTLQLLSAISHCLEQGHPLAEADFRDIYLISNPYCLGETVAFLPQLRSPENQQMDTVCYFLEKFLDDMCIRCEATTVLDDDAYTYFAGIQKIISMLQSGAVECLPVVRSYTEFLLWGPQESDLQSGDDRLSNLEPKLSMWLEKQRAGLIHDFAKRTQNGARCRIEDFYNMKFLLKASSGSLAECIRCHAAS